MPLNITKVDKKRLSLYDLGGKVSDADKRAEKSRTR